MPALHHLALRVADPDRSAAFYTGVLGLSELRRVADASGLHAVWLRTGDLVLMLERRLRGRGASEGSGHLLALAVSDLAGVRERLARAGVLVEDCTDHTLYFRDPDGHRLGLSDFSFAAFG